MTAATALIAGNDPLPELAGEAVAQALARAGLTHANGVLLFLTADFARSAQAAVHAAACAGNCLQVAGGIVAGVANEKSWVFDRPAAVALVLGGDDTLGPADDNAGQIIGIAGDAPLPAAWRTASSRCGLLFRDPLNQHPFPAWQQGRLTAEHHASVNIVGSQRHVAVSTGLRRLGAVHRITGADGCKLESLNALAAVNVLRGDLHIAPAAPAPGAGSIDLGVPVHHLCAIAVTAAGTAPGTAERLIPVMSANADGSITLGERLGVGELIVWGLRDPDNARDEMRSTLNGLAAACPEPDFGLFFSCIGRGPCFYVDADHDWQLFAERFRGMPFIGAYGSGQIAPAYGPRVLQSCVVLNTFAASRREKA